jgi:DNA-binding response OmpR family regulator
MMNNNVTTVLIGEDDDDDFLIFSSVIKELHFDVLLTRAENGDLVIKLIDQENPDILFLDILLPLKDGRKCIQEIRANKKYDSLPVIVYTALSDLESIEFFYRNGANLYVVKPSSFADLKAALEKIFSIDWKKVMYYPPLSQFVLKAS